MNWQEGHLEDDVWDIYSCNFQNMQMMKTTKRDGVRVVSRSLLFQLWYRPCFDIVNTRRLKCQEGGLLLRSSS